MKLGGSVLTDKSAYRTLRAPEVTRLGRELAAAGPGLLVVHGAGSFGHTLARKHGLSGGLPAAAPARAAALRGAAEVHADVRALHEAVLGAMREAGLAPFGAPAWSLARLRGGRLDHLDLSPLLLAPEGAVPVTCGDVVPDAERGVGILSGDDLVREAGLALRRAGEEVDVLFALAADGVLDAAGRLLPRLARDAPIPAAPTAGADVTGGIVKKVQAARALAAAGARVRLVNGLSPGRLSALLAGREAPCTEMEG